MKRGRDTQASRKNIQNDMNLKKEKVNMKGKDKEKN
jgi:hypothetical protein